MIATRKMCPLLAAVICLTLGSMTSASAVTAEVAKKCSSLSAKAFPQSQAGNPAARSAGETGLSQRSYFERCVSNEENENSATPEGEK